VKKKQEFHLHHHRRLLRHRRLRRLQLQECQPIAQDFLKFLTQ
jgi:hypothetical protein